MRESEKQREGEKEKEREINDLWTALEESQISEQSKHAMKSCLTI